MSLFNSLHGASRPVSMFSCNNGLRALFQSPVATPRALVKIHSKSVSGLTQLRSSNASTAGSFFGKRPSLYIRRAAGVSAVGLCLSAFALPVISCESSDTPYHFHPATAPPPPPPTSSVNLYELSFGTVCGICAGVFVKKGAKALAFVLGGVFVLLQYLGSVSLVRVDWARAGSRFESLFYTRSADGTGRRPPTVYALWRWLVDFLVADFQPRASFIAGMALGLRLG